MLDYRSTVAATVFAAAMLVGCSEPDLPTNLRTSGPPNVTTVTVLTDEETGPDDPRATGLGRLVETATYCRIGDNKRPGIVGLPDIRTITVCPLDLSKPADDNGTAAAVPPDWFFRIVFDKLLDAKVEDLMPVLDDSGIQTGTIGTLRNTQPVTLQCNGVDVPYDGYYAPNGNNSSWALGPALFIQPSDPTSVPVGADCKVSIKDMVHNKAGQSVPPDQRDYTFKISPMHLRFSVPDPGDDDPGKIVQDPTAPIQFWFNAALKQGAKVGDITLTNLDTTKVTITSAPNTDVTATDADGKGNTMLCDGSIAGTPVPTADIRAYIDGDAGDSTALIMDLDVGGTTAPDLLWAGATTYLVTFAAGAAVSPSQGGADVALPADFSLCFHTTAAPTM